MMQSHHNLQWTQVERSKKRAVRIVNLCIEPFPYFELQHLILLVILFDNVPGLIHDAPLRTFTVGTIIVILELQGQIEISVKI